jgi:hypothetical protein
MIAMMWALDANGLQGRIHVFNALQQPVPVQVIANNGGTYTIQLPNATPNSSYFIEVAAANPNATSQNTGNYSLTADFHQQQLVSFDDITSGTLTGSQNQTSGSLTTNREQLFHFALTCNSVNSNAWVMMTILDSNGNVVGTIRARAGQPTVTSEIYLKKAAYSVVFSAYTTDGSAIGAINFDLAGDAISSPVGAYSTSSSSGSSSTYSGSGSSGSGTTTTSSTSSSAQAYYY